MLIVREPEGGAKLNIPFRSADSSKSGARICLGGLGPGGRS